MRRFPSIVAVALFLLSAAPVGAASRARSAKQVLPADQTSPSKESAAVRDLRIAADRGELDAVARLKKMGVPYRKPWTPFRLSAWPQPDFQTSFPKSPYVRGLSLGISIAQDTEAFGLQIAPLPMAVRGAGLQLGGSVHAQRFYGVQIGLLSASAGRFGGIQISGMNNTDGMNKRSCGFQLGVVNGGAAVRGVQIGAGNGGRDMRGLQIGVYNQAGKAFPAAQIGGINRTLSGKDRSRGFQIGAVNLSRARFSGFQIGVFNACGSLRGVQLGVLNRVGDRRFLGGVLPLLNIGW